MRSLRRVLRAGLVVVLAAGALASSAAASSAPSIEGLSASYVTKDDATIEAQINPEGLETTYEFWMPIEPCNSPMECIEVQHVLVAQGSIPATTAHELISVDLASEHVAMEPGTWYNFSIVASNAAGTVKDQGTFRTLSAYVEPPSIENESASNVTEQGATLEAKVNPHGEQTYRTTWVFEYGTSTSYGQSTAPPGLFNSEACKHIEIVPCGINTLRPVSESVSELEPGTTYHYRIVATSEAGTSYGSDATFTTQGPPKRALNGEQSSPSTSGEQSASTTNGSGQAASSSTPTKAVGPSAPTATTPLVSPLVKPVQPEVLTRLEYFVKALKRCKQQTKDKRASCERQVHGKYAEAAKKTGKKAAS